MSMRTGAIGRSPRRNSNASVSVGTAITSMPWITAASRALSGGTSSPRRPHARTAAATGNAPRTALTRPSSDSSPRLAYACSWSGGNWPLAASMPSAIGRSKAAPSFFTSAGARFTVMRRADTW